MTTSRRRTLLLAAIAIATVAVAAWLRRTSEPAPDPAGEDDGAGAPGPVAELEWLAGCWEHEEPGFRRVEQWMRPEGGSMLGMSRTVADGRTVEFEYLRIEVRDGRLVYVALPSGQLETTFLESERSDGSVSFAAPEHDFPQRIVYERVSPRGLLAWIEGEVDGVSRVIEFPMRAARCP